MLPDNTVVGRYQIARRVAQGGMGTLYLAQDPVLGRPVALKIFLGDLDLLDARESFAREARAAATLNHPHIVTIYDYGEYSSQPYMVMEFIQGETLAALIRRHADVPIGTKLRWMEELCSAVEYAHGQGVIHRDLKPLNLMVDAGDRLKVLDFGIARMRGSLASHATARIGSAAYMAPEQIRGGNIDHRSDLFSIGVVCYELISFVEPFAADVDIAITRHILEDDPTPLQELDPTIDPQLADLVWKALRKDPASRFQDAESMRKALAAVRTNLEASPTETAIRQRPALPAADATPRPSRETPEKRAERDALVRERTAQIQVSLRLARQSLEAGQLSAARAECDKVLRLDNAQPEALALARRIDLEVIRAEAGLLLTQGHEELQHGAITKAVELLDRARELSPDNPEAGRLDRAVRIARAQQDVERRRGDRFRQEIHAADQALGRGAYEDALGHAREALEIDPASAEALALEEEALRLIGDDTSQLAEKTVMLPPGRRRDQPTGPTEIKKPSAVAAPVRARRWQDALVLFRDRVARLADRWRLIPSRQRAMVLWGATATAVLAVILIVWVSTRSGPEVAKPIQTVAPAAPVAVVIDAIPWARVTQVVLDGGSAVPLGEEPTYTPLMLPLLPGRYHVTLQGPGPQGELRTVEYDVAPGVEPPGPARFEPITADSYFGSVPKAKSPIAKSGGVR